MKIGIQRNHRIKFLWKHYKFIGLLMMRFIISNLDFMVYWCNFDQTVVISNYNCTAWNCSSVIFHCYKVFGPNLTFCLSGIDAVGQMLPILIYWILYCHIKKPLMMKLNYSPLQNWKQCTRLSHYILNFFIWET